MNYLLLAQEAGADSSGFFSFINILWVFVGLISLIAFIGLFGKYIAPLIEHLPPWLIEVGAYTASVCGAFVAPKFFGPTVSFIAALISIPVFSGAIAYRLGENWRITLANIIFFTACAAHLHQSAFFGGISVLVLLGLCGSWVFPFLDQVIPEEDGHVVPSGFWSSAAILGVAGYLSFTTNPEWFLVFKPGAFWLAGIVYTGGLMTLSNRFYYKGNITPGWLLWQIVAVASGVGALFLGHTYASYLGTTVLQEIGGSFLALYLISKIAEIPWNFDHWPWIAMGVALAGYFAVDFAAKHPQYFLGF